VKLGTILLIWLTIMVLVPQIAYAADPVCHIVESGDNGKPFVSSQPESEATKSFIKIVEKVIEGGTK